MDRAARLIILERGRSGNGNGTGFATVAQYHICLEFFPKKKNKYRTNKHPWTSMVVMHVVFLS